LDLYELEGRGGGERERERGMFTFLGGERRGEKGLGGMGCWSLERREGKFELASCSLAAKGQASTVEVFSRDISMHLD